MWDAPYMETQSPLQSAIQRAIIASGKTRDHFDTQLRAILKTSGKPLWDIERGKSRSPKPATLRAIEDVLGLSAGALVLIAHPEAVADLSPTRTVGAGETVPILRLNLALPMGQGATVDDYIEEEPFTFDLGYVRSFTRTPPDRLRLALGVGDSMFPTLMSSDLVWIDSTQRVLNQSDRIWAVSINGAAAIKRLRPLKDNRVLVISDNKAIGDYEVGRDEILIGGRVIRFARDV